MDAQQLRDLIGHLDDLYYNQAISEVSDLEYDALRARLEELEGEQRDLPGAPTGLFPKYKHPYPVTSLAKVNTEEKLRTELARLMPVVIMPKFDGLTVVKYPDSAAVTRGDGEVGDDVRVNFTNFDYPYDLPLRGEAIIKRDDFIALNDLRKREGEEPFKNRRNAVAGIMRSKDNKYKDYVSYQVFEVIGDTGYLTDALKSVADNTPYDVTDYWEFNDVDRAVDFILNFDRDSYMFELDGLVIKTGQANSLEKFGRTSHHPKDAVAYKFPAQGKWTKLKQVHWTVGRTGKVVPNAVFEPIEILDAMVQNATLHNIAYIDAIKLSIGCDINVIKANDVIPAVIASQNYNPLTRIRAPKECPICSSELEKVNDQLYCRNNSCESKLLTHLVHLASKDAMDIRGLSEQTLLKFIEDGNIKKVTDLFGLLYDQIEETDGFSHVSATNLLKAIQASRNVEFNRLIVSANIPNVGRTASKDIAKKIKGLRELEQDIANGFPIIGAIDGIGDTIMNSLKYHYGSVLELSMAMESITNSLYGEAAKVGGYTICVTGKFEKPRTHYQELIESAGHQFASSVTKKTTHLLAGEAAGSKIEKAEKLGIPVLTEEEFLALIGG